MILSDIGVMLVDIYIVGGEVLMGMLCWEKECVECVVVEVVEVNVKFKWVRLDVEEVEFEV